ncbi:hypothetical protein M422DRAFT_273483 [Sphaerobolus stellatus SS14]|uniref:Uncharacterized protein n=1 Tax=Sphaerobolus stellatus (strain SS14) TaxID=990650 RepID=A0A0C9T905_SPHS4|nr:hypothetical protein M422DRAFT_273483 [Sphaerobolus stellatus SS14]
MSKVSHNARFAKRQPAASSSGCTSGAFYKSPKKGDTIDTSQPLKIEWDTSLNCFSSQGVDIYLYAPYTSKGLLHAWGGVSYSAGSFETDLQGSWWNSTIAPISLNLAFVVSGDPIFTSSVSQGPIFSATFNTTDYGLKHPTGGTNTTTTVSSGSGSSESSGIFQVIGNAYKNLGLPKGSIAAAVIIPLLAIGVGIFFYIRWTRRKEGEKRKRWSQAVDKRMSSISGDWKTLPPNAQSEAIRQSIAIMRNSRASMARMSEIYADGRPSSTFTGYRRWSPSNVHGFRTNVQP